MRTHEWFEDWAERHVERFPRHDWPAPGNEFWETLRHIFITKGVTEPVADEASKRLFEEPPAFPADLPKALLGAIREVLKSQPVASGGSPPNDRDAAAKASLDCPECGGQGLASRLLMQRDGVRRWNALYCFCPLGRWIEHNHRTKSPDVRKRIQNLSDLREPTPADEAAIF